MLQWLHFRDTIYPLAEKKAKNESEEIGDDPKLSGANIWAMVMHRVI